MANFSTQKYQRTSTAIFNSFEEADKFRKTLKPGKDQRVKLKVHGDKFHVIMQEKLPDESIEKIAANMQQRHEANLKKRNSIKVINLSETTNA